MGFDSQNIKQILAQSRRPLTGRDIAARLGLTARETRQLYDHIKAMVRRGEVKHQRNGRYSLPGGHKLIRGRLQLLRSGAGVVAPEGGGHEIFVPAQALAGAMAGDLVEVLPTPVGRGQRPRGQVLRVVEGHGEFVGIFRLGRHGGVVAPLDDTLQSALLVTESLPSDLQPGQVVVASTAVSKGDRRQTRIVKVLGAADSPEVEVLAVAHRFGLPTDFSPAAVQAASEVSQLVSTEEAASRVDFRHLPFVTIDGETAKDFDDAVALQEEADGHYRLWVAIADVDHYVSEGSALDREALHRGTSVYFPGVCLPMLPEALSNGICSLNPQADRLVLVAEMLFNANGERLGMVFARGVINSRARLTYTGVHQFLNDPASDEPPEHLAQLRPMARLASALTMMRRKRGSLDLDLPEAEVVVGSDGSPETIRRAVRFEAHRLIEEFMLAANEAVATALSTAGFPVVYRIHEPPQGHDLDAFYAYARYLGAQIPRPGLPLIAGLQQMLKAMPDDATRHLLHRQLLRSLNQARYDVVNRGHFGLAAEEYCHFTSPIRRYPDLAVHRLLKALLRGAEPTAYDRTALQTLGTVAESSSLAERRAVDAERDMTALKCCQVMQQHVGERFTGRVASVHAFGFFAELDEFFVEGLVHVSSLGDDYYYFDPERFRLIGERTQRQFAPGTAVTVQVLRADPVRREIDLALAEGGESRQAPRRIRARNFRERSGRRV